MWLPDGAIIRAELERFSAELGARTDCQRVYTPVLAKRALFEQSGHWAKFSDDMFPVMDVGGEQYVLRPTSCPQHALLFASEGRSYRDLPIRYSEIVAQFRTELSGVLTGMSRVRQMNLDDCHVFCAEDQIRTEVLLALRTIRAAYDVLGITVDDYRLSRRGDGQKHDSQKYLGEKELWARSEHLLREALCDFGVDFVEAEGEAAFYGPKIDIQVRGSGERSATLSTVQLDFNQPDRFDLEYVAADGSRRRPVMIHRGLLSTMERMVAHLIEHYNGAFPPWIAPRQVVILPVADRHADAAYRLRDRARDAGLRASVDGAEATLGARMRAVRERRVPYAVVLGDREVESGRIGVRLRDGSDAAGLDPVAALAEIGRVVSHRERELGFGAGADAPIPSGSLLG